MDLPLSVLSQVTAILEQQNISYVLVGSFASSIHGMYRSTADIDILADIHTEQIRTLFEILQNSFYVDEHAMRDAVAQGRSFNAIHFDSVFKVDIFIAGADEFALTQLKRRQLRKISPEKDDALYVASAEDTVLAKLRWYRAGHETSNTQWNDVLGVLGASGSYLDLEYLHTWASKLGIEDLLQKVLDDIQDESDL
jgi:predicted nucleotidyltransferase